MYAPPAYNAPMPMVLSNTAYHSLLSVRLGLNVAVPASQTDIAANQAIYVPFIVTSTTTWTRGFWWNGSAVDGTKNVSVGIYTPDGTRQATTGNVAASGNSVIQTAAFSASYTTTPGVYMMAYEVSVGADANGVFGYSATVLWRQGGSPYTQAVGANPLPSSATFATWSSMVMPYFGIARTSFAI